MVFSRWLFILIGNNRTGKTTIQRKLVELLNGQCYMSLPSDGLYDLTDFAFPQKCRRIFVAGRSYQEARGTTRYQTVEEYFERTLSRAGDDVCLAFMASHLDTPSVSEMISQGQNRFWNVCGIFLSNAVATSPAANHEISRLPWNERWFVQNPTTDDERIRNRQLDDIAGGIVQMLVERTRGW